MSRNHCTSILLFFFCVASLSCLAQTHNALSISIIKESTKLPSKRNFGTPFHPGIEVGYDRFLNDHTKHQPFASIKIGYYFHQDLHHGITLKPSFGYQYVSGQNIMLGVDINLGLLHAFSDHTLYEQNNEGRYIKIRNSGKLKLLPTLSFLSGYQFKNDNIKQLDLFIKYEFGIEAPFSKGIDIPIFPHSFIHIGTRWYAFN